MDHHRQVAPTDSASQSLQTHYVVEVPVRQDNPFECLGRDGETIEVVDETIGTHPGVEQNPMAASADLDLNQSRVAMFGFDKVGTLASFGQIGGDDRHRPGGADWPPSPRRTEVGHQNVDVVVDQRRDTDPINRL
jgi:hypothetical protein